MSTMYEALKRAEAERKKSLGSSSSNRSRPDGVNRSLLPGPAVRVGLIACAVVVGVFICQLFLRQVKTGLAQRQTAQVTQTLVKQQEPYRLEGIIAAGPQSMAVINGKLFKPGERVGDMRLMLIEEGRVQLKSEKDASSLTLDLQS